MSKQIFWSKLEKESSGDTDAIVPGVTVPGNRRPRRPPKSSKGSGRKLQEVKAKIPAKQPVIVETLSPETTNTFNDISTSLEETASKPTQRRAQGKPASLKDLCAEDKKRVANLIKELAKMGDEKERVTGQLKEERQVFEKQMLQLVEQQEQILREREDIQSRYFQCQDLLARYKDQVLDCENNDDIQSPLTRKGHRKEKPRDRSRSPEPVIRDDHHVSPRLRKESNKENVEFQDPRINKKLADLENARTSVRRPYTSMIDKEIAQKKHYHPECPSTIVAESGSSTPRMQIGYNDKVPTLKTFREPIMSSTQKSSDIRKELEEFMPLEPDSSPRSTIQDSTPRGRSGSKVGFKDRPEFNDEDLHKHSPSLGDSNIVGDRQFMEKYKKLNAGERKRELLKQRELLLKEQEKLKKILVEQERALRSKENQLRKKQELQKDRLDYFEKNGNFPRREDPVKANDIDDGSLFNGKVEKLNFDKHLSDDEFKPLSDDDDIPFESDEKRRREQEDIKNYTTKATSPLRRPFHSMATSPIRPEAHPGPEAPAAPSRVDACTSVSRIWDNEVNNKQTPTKADNASASSLYKNQSSPTSPRLADFSGEVQQNNLPFQSNRQRSTDSPTFKGPRTPGDKTLSVVEIVNSLEESPSWKGSPYKSGLSPGRSEVAQGRVRDSPRVAGTAKIFSTTPERGLYGGEVVRDRFDETEAEETAEESEILDDIFFLK